MVIDFVKTSPSQNTTVLVTSFCPPKRYVEVAKKVMEHEYLYAEQVGFIIPPKNADSVVGLEMAGGEFCGNASLSAAAYAKYKGYCDNVEFNIDVSGAEHPLKCCVTLKTSFVYRAKCEMPQPISIREFTAKIRGRDLTGTIIELEGISHFVFEQWPELTLFDDVLELLKDKIMAKAIGIIPYRKLGELEYEIKPYVYVRDTNTRVFEKGCGSGSLALGLHLKNEITEEIKVRQPGGIIYVETGDTNYISTDVRFICEGSVFID